MWPKLQRHQAKKTLAPKGTFVGKFLWSSCSCRKSLVEGSLIQNGLEKDPQQSEGLELRELCSKELCGRAEVAEATIAEAMSKNRAKFLVASGIFL